VDESEVLRASDGALFISGHVAESQYDC